MASEGEAADEVNGDDSLVEPETLHMTGPAPSLSHVTLPSTELAWSPDPGDLRPGGEPNDRVIASSLTPPMDGAAEGRTESPSAVTETWHDGYGGRGYVAPWTRKVLDASADELRVMLQMAMAEQQRFKMEAAHHKLQYNLLRLQADEEAKRAAVEHGMVRRDVDALRLAEQSRQARRELSASADSRQLKYLQMKQCYEEAAADKEALQRRLKAAKKVIQQKEEEMISLTEERDVLLTRIRENREHIHMLCSPGGIFHSALTPRQQQREQREQREQRAGGHEGSKAARRDEHEGQEHGLTALIQAMSQDNASAPSTPRSTHRAVQRYLGKHSRNAQSLSSLPTAPLNRRDEASMPASAELVPQTEPRSRNNKMRSAPSTSKRDGWRRSRESTISADDTEELARQAVESAAAAAAAQSPARGVQQRGHAGGGGRGGHAGQVSDGQASRAAAEKMLRRRASERHEARGGAEAGDDGMAGPVEKSARMQARLLSDAPELTTDKRKHGGSVDGGEPRDQASPAKRMRGGRAAKGGAAADGGTGHPVRQVNAGRSRGREP